MYDPRQLRSACCSVMLCGPAGKCMDWTWVEREDGVGVDVYQWIGLKP